MIELLKYIDTRLFLFFNGNHTDFMDSVMMAVTGKFTWIPLYALLLFFVWKKTKSKMWLVVLSVAVLITFSDQISVHLFKETFQRYRPCHNLLLKDKIHLLNGECGGLYGFVSSHAANTFALATFLIFFFCRRDFALCMYLWAAFVSYSRVYVGVHYPFDILGGMVLGIFLGAIGYKIYFHLNKKYAD
ncbi:MAG: phosphatase PAP2 family protein [Bacteroidetes bacterium]|nr:phosphatase PAP2 family protein [Bacteroidota bacterium]